MRSTASRWRHWCCMAHWWRCVPGAFSCRAPFASAAARNSSTIAADGRSVAPPHAWYAEDRGWRRRASRSTRGSDRSEVEKGRLRWDQDQRKWVVTRKSFKCCFGSILFDFCESITFRCCSKQALSVSHVRQRATCFHSKQTDSSPMDYGIWV